MRSIRLVLLSAVLLTLPIAGTLAQQTNQSTTGGSALRSTTPGSPNDARSSAPDSTSSGGSTLKETTVGDTGKKVVGTPDRRSPGKPSDSGEK
jgi:hypothetical protein